MSEDKPRGRDVLGQRSEDLMDREAARLAAHPRRTVARYLAYFAAVVLGLVVFFGVIGFVAGWFNAGKDVASPANVKNQYRLVIDDWQSLEASAGNYCQALVQQKSNPDTAPTLVEDPGFAYAASYRRTAVDYNRRQANIFEAKAVGPKGYPRTAPTLKQMQGRVC